MGLYLRRVVLQYPRLGWQGSTGIHGSFQPESVATFDWNQWQLSTGISGNFRPEYAPTRRPVAAVGVSHATPIMSVSGWVGSPSGVSSAPRVARCSRSCPTSSYAIARCARMWL